MSGDAKPGRAGIWRRALSRLTSSQDALEDAELQEDVLQSGYDPVRTCADREVVRLRGTLRTVTLRPRAGTPSLEADLYDGSGTVTLVWLGRRRIAGIEPDRAIVVEGRIAVQDDRRIMYNPRYELQPIGE
ncbi:OB-fold nucleic acid binding domain-containing protein [Actinopolymorpha alba]|uniref:OB-fold nucleic acid binding domain-containing protein n=1 Tax=Actinopolymorpha alba TaxID=533267 RepID=UPI00036FDDBC|nr:OB-fold nucleic acid binding domain-containing protein [Actinopolymorpha alba]